MTAIEREDPQPRTLGQESADYLLVEQARAGDQEAFGELVRRHRAEALGWAGRLTGDSHLAEDIVQEALLRAFLHMGTLANTDRFTPWLQRIVRNQAYMKLRRGGPFGKEQPYASLGPREKQAGAAGNGLEATGWGDLDQIMARLANHAAEEALRRYHPEDCLIRKETLESIRLLIHCLTKREREIFEARFFGELPPQEIAALFQMTTANVYNLLSRSRAKLHKERTRISIQMYVQRRGELGLPRRNILAPPRI